MPLANRDPITLYTEFESVVEKINLLLGNLDYNIEDLVGAMVGAGSSQDGITVTYDSLNKKLDFDVTGGGGGGDTEVIQDTVGAMFVHGGHTGITATYNDVLGLITLAVIDTYVSNSGDTMTGDLLMNGSARIIKTQVSTFGASASFADAGIVVGPNATTGVAIGRDAVKSNGGTLTLGSISNHDVIAVRQNVAYLSLVASGILLQNNLLINNVSAHFQASGNTQASAVADASGLIISAATNSKSVRLRGGNNTDVIRIGSVGASDMFQFYHGGVEKVRSTSSGIIYYDNIDINSNRIIGLPVPVNGHEAANKNYVDGRTAGPIYINPFVFYSAGSTGAGTQSGSFSTPGVFPAGSRYAMVRAFVPINTGQTITQARPNGTSPWITIVGTVGSGGDETNHGTYVTLAIPLRNDGVFFWQIVSTSGFNSAELAIVGYIQ